jgi:hypothetical protein
MLHAVALWRVLWAAGSSCDLRRSCQALEKKKVHIWDEGKRNGTGKRIACFGGIGVGYKDIIDLWPDLLMVRGKAGERAS